MPKENMMKIKWIEQTKKVMSLVVFIQMVFGLLAPTMVFAAAPTLVQADQNDPDTAFHTQDSTPTLTGATIGGTTVTVTVNSFTCVSPVVSSGWSCDGSFITTPLTPNVLYSIRMDASNADGSIITTDLTGVIVDTVGPVISERNPIAVRTSDNTPQYDFNTDSYGAITYAGGCSSGQTSAYDPWQRLDFLPLADGLYDSCTIYTTDSAGNQSNTINVSDFTVDTTGPSFNPLGLESWSNVDPTVVTLTGDLVSGWNLERDGEATTDFYVDFRDATASDGNMDVGYHGLKLVDYTGGLQGIALAQYYNDRGVPAPFLQYLIEAAAAIKPFAYIKTDGTNHPTLIDAAKHDLLGVDVPMTIPGDFPEGEYNVSGRIADDLGNEAILDYKLIVGDITAPTLTQVTPVPSLTNVITPSYTFNSDEEGDITYGGSCSSATTTAVDGDNTIIFDTLSDGIYGDCKITITDESGNASVALAVSEFEVDASAPVTSLAYSGGTSGANGWWKGGTAPAITLSTEESATIYWKWDDESVYTSGTVDQNPVVVEGVRTLEFYSVDPATNEELPHQYEEVKYDGTAPTGGSIVINDGDEWSSSGEVELDLDAVDGLSGVNKMRLRNGASGTFQTAVAFVAEYDWSLPAGEDEKTVSVRFVDKAGNLSVTYSDTIKVDLTVPTIQNISLEDVNGIDYNPFAKGDKDIYVRADVSDTYAGIDALSCEMTLDGGTTWTPADFYSATNECVGYILADTYGEGETISVALRVRDNAENSNSIADGRISDSDGPTPGAMVVTPIYQDTIAGSVNISVPMSDQAGVTDCQFRYWLDDFNDETNDWSNWVGGFWNSTESKCEIDFGGLQHGRIYKFRMRGIDGLGHRGAVVNSGPKVADAEAPEVDYVDPTPVDGLLTTQNSQTFVVDTDSDVASCTIDLGLRSGDFESGTNGWNISGYSQVVTDNYYSASHSLLLQTTNDNMGGSNNYAYTTVTLPSTGPINLDAWIMQSTTDGIWWDQQRIFLTDENGNHLTDLLYTLTNSGWHNVNYDLSAFAGRTVRVYFWLHDDGAGDPSRMWVDDVNITGTDFGGLAPEMINNGDGTWSYGPVTLPDGLRSYNITCTDRVGNTTTTENRTLTIDTTAPTVPTLVSPLNNSYVNGGTLVNDWSDSPESDLHHYVYESFRDSGATQLRWRQTVNAPTSEKSATNVANTTFWWRVKAVDNLGNESAWSELWKVTVDNDNPVPSLDLIDYYGEDDGYIYYGWVGVEASASDLSSGVAEYKLFDPEGEEPGWSTYEGSISTSMYTYDYWSEGERTITFKVRDFAGNEAEISETIIIDQTAPGSSVNTLAEYINTEKFNVTITSGDPDINRLVLNSMDLNFEEEGLPGSGVDYVELWYRKDNHECPVQETDAVSVLVRRDECIDGYVQYKHYVENAEPTVATPEIGYWSERFDPSTPIEFDTTQIDEDGNSIGGDGYYEFFSVAVDEVGNREMYPGNVALGDASVLGIPIFEEIAPDTHTIVDTQKPVITLTGADEINLVVGANYNELGAVWTDTQDGTGNAVVGGEAVDTNSVGNYVVTYNYTDKAGNIATEVTRTVNVTAVPLISRILTPLALAAPAGVDQITEEPTEEEVLGDDTQDVAGEENNQDSNVDSTQACYLILGICWYWWILIFLLVGGAWYWYYDRRKKNRI